MMVHQYHVNIIQISIMQSSISPTTSSNEMLKCWCGCSLMHKNTMLMMAKPSCFVYALVVIVHTMPMALAVASPT